MAENWAWLSENAGCGGVLVANTLTIRPTVGSFLLTYISFKPMTGGGYRELLIGKPRLPNHRRHAPTVIPERVNAMKPGSEPQQV